MLARRGNDSTYEVKLQKTQPNHHFPEVLLVQVLWLSCDKTIYEISSRKLKEKRDSRRKERSERRAEEGSVGMFEGWGKKGR